MDNPEREIITIKEFAKREGITVQAVYSRIKGSLKPYTLTFNGVKSIDYTAYSRHKLPVEEKPSIKVGLNDDIKDFKPPIKPPLNPEQDTLIDTLQEQVKTLTEQLDAEKAARLDDERRHNQQIIEITQMHQQQIQFYQTQIQEMTQALRAAQALEADARIEIKELRAPAPDPQPEQETEKKQPERRHNWLYRLFAKKG